MADKERQRGGEDIGTLRRQAAKAYAASELANRRVKEAEEDRHDREYPPVLIYDEGEFLKLTLHDGFGFVRNATEEDLAKPRHRLPTDEVAALRAEGESSP